jgi:predicted nuclease of restriction endonuclease-like (RecB) superfamily
VSPELQIPTERLIKSLSFSHFAELIAVEDPLKRVFYEIERIRGNWSVRELKRQISSLYYERSGLSKNKEKLAEMVKSGAEPVEPELAVRDPYIFEFLGLRPGRSVS